MNLGRSLGANSVERLGDGAYGPVLRLRRESEDLVVRFLRDAGAVLSLFRLWSRVRHDVLILPIRVGVAASGRPWIARRFCEGDVLDGSAPSKNDDRWPSLVGQWLDALSALHSAGWVHGDVKPANMLVAAGGARLFDFDLAVELGVGETDGGTRRWLAPELLAGEQADARSDLFSLGASIACALLGDVPADFSARFPDEDFWTASDLDEADLPLFAKELLRSILRRDPASRPSSAQAAAGLLPGIGPMAGALALPPLLGRSEALFDLARKYRRQGKCLVVEADDPRDREDVLLVLSFAAAAEGHSVDLVETALSEKDFLCSGEAGGFAGIVGLDHRGDGAILVEPLMAASRLPAFSLHCVCTLEQGARVRREAARDLDDVVHWHTLDEVSPEALEGYLRSKITLSSGSLVAELAADLHAKTEGRQSALESAVVSAAELGVVRRMADGWALERSRWPAVAETPGKTLPSLSDQARRVLAALSDAPEGMSQAAILRAVGVTVESFRSAAGELERLGLPVLDDRPMLANWRIRGRGFLPPSVRRSVSIQLVEAHRAAGLPTGSRMRVEGLAGGDLKDALEVVERSRLDGRLARARVLIDALRDPDTLLDAVTELRVSLLGAKLDLAQGNYSLAVECLEEVLSTAGPEAESLRSQATVALGDVLQKVGKRAAAAGHYRVVLDRRPDADVALRAEVGVAHLSLLSGQFEDVLQRLDLVALDGASIEAQGSAHNLRGGALLRLNRFSDARGEFDRALALGDASSDCGLRARALLNRGIVERNLGHLSDAADCLKQAAAAVDHSDLFGIRALVAHNLGTLLRDRGELSRARESLARALRLRRRIGDDYGEATTQASLALLALEQGCVGEATKELQAARTRLEEGGHTSEVRLMDQHLRLSLAGLAVGERLVAPDSDAVDTWTASGELPDPDESLLGARAATLEALAAGRPEAANQLMESALQRHRNSTSIAERFRSTALAHSLLAPGAHRGRLSTELLDLARRMGSAREREARFRVECPRTIEDLAGLCEAFKGDGRTDLEWCASVMLVQLAKQVGNSQARRLAAKSVGESEEILTERAEPEKRGAILALMSLLAGPSVHGAQTIAGESATVNSIDEEWYRAITRQLAVSDDLDDLLALVLDRALEGTAGRRGLLLLQTPAGLEAMSCRGLGPGEASDGDLHLSGSVVRSAIESGTPVLTQDIASDPRFSDAASVQSLELRAIICVPVLGPDGPFGALYVDDDRKGALFDRTDLNLLATLADQAGAVARQIMARNEIARLNTVLEARVENQQKELVAVRTQLRVTGHSPAIAGMVGDSPAMRSLRDQIRRLANTELAVLITGPSGAGKELVARAIHTLGKRDRGPFVVENMAALSGSLMESEFFGHSRGAFTGASSARVGLFEEADGGTLFLDELGDLDLTLQAKLLRVLESGEFRRVGESAPRRADVRLVAATNADMEARVAGGQFRSDLYYRLNAAEITVPSLSERQEDIPLLIEHFLELLSKRHDEHKEVDREILAALVSRPWPGEVRELRNEVQRLFLLSGTRIEDRGLLSVVPATVPSISSAIEGPYTLLEAESRAIQRAISAADGNRAEAARLLGISRAGFYNKLKRLGLG